MKILEFAKKIYSGETLKWVEEAIEKYEENAWHNEPEKAYYKGYIVFSYRTIQIYNANGYQGGVKQFLWRANMDYHQLLTSEPQPMQPATTDYAAQLATIKTLPELFDFRAKLKAELNSEVFAYMKVFADATTENAQSAQITEIKFFIDRAESQIKALENNGIFLAAVDGRGAVYGLDFSSGQSTHVEKTTWSVSGSGLSPIEAKAKRLGLLDKLKELQSISNEFQWIYADEKFDELYGYGIVVKLSILNSSEYAYLWRHEMDYENFFQIKNPPKN